MQFSGYNYRAVSWYCRQDGKGRRERAQMECQTNGCGRPLQGAVHCDCEYRPGRGRPTGGKHYARIGRTSEFNTTPFFSSLFFPC